MMPAMPDNDSARLYVGDVSTMEPPAVGGDIAVEHLTRAEQYGTREDWKLSAVGDRIRQLDREGPLAGTTGATPRRFHGLKATPGVRRWEGRARLTSVASWLARCVTHRRWLADR